MSYVIYVCHSVTLCNTSQAESLSICHTNVTQIINMKKKSPKASTEDKWAEVRIPKDMLNRLEEFLGSNFAKRLGFTNKSMVVATAIRALMNESERVMSYMELIDVDPYRVLIMDHEIDETIEVTNNDVKCSKHGKAACDHIKFAWMLPIFANKNKDKDKDKKPSQENNNLV